MALHFTASMQNIKVVCYNMIFTLTGNRKLNIESLTYLYEARSEANCIVWLPGEKMKATSDIVEVEEIPFDGSLLSVAAESLVSQFSDSKDSAF